MFPAGSRVVRNPYGTAPGIDLEIAREGTVPIFVSAKMGLSPLTKPTPCRVICLPGVPAEMIEMWHDSVGAAIEAFVGPEHRVIRRRLLHCFGAGESRIEEMLPDLIRRGRRPTVGITASKATITLRIAADGATEEECLAAIAPVEATIRECLGTLVFGEGDDELQHAVVRLLRQRGKTFATAECGTAGLMAAWLAARSHGRRLSRRACLHARGLSQFSSQRKWDCPLRHDRTCRCDGNSLPRTVRRRLRAGHRPPLSFRERGRG